MTESLQTKEFSACGLCGHPDCRDCFPWPDTDTAEVRALREHLALSQEESAGKDSFIASQTEEINRLRLFAMQDQLVPESEEIMLRAELGICKADNAELKRSLGVAESRIQILSDGHAQMKEILDERETEIVRLKEFEWKYNDLCK